MYPIYMSIIFFTIFSLLFAGMQYYLYRKFRRWGLITLSHHDYRAYKKYFVLTFITGNVFVLARVMVTYFGWYQSVPGRIIAYANGFFFASVVFGFVVLVIITFARFQYKMICDILRKIRKQKPRGEYSPERRKFVKFTGQAVIGAIAGVPIIATLATSKNYIIKRQKLVFPNLPAGLHGFTFTQISDIHSGIYMTEKDIHEIFQIVNGLHPHMIMITGDFVDTSQSEIPAIVNTITDLKADYGVHGVLGNHDHYAGTEKVYAAISPKINLLRNDHKTLNINGEKLSIIGVDDAGYGDSNFADLPKAMNYLDQDSFKLLMSHRPGFFDQAQKAGIDLTLSGHTHGGQVAFKVLGLDINPAALVHKYVSGLYQNAEHKLYVNDGLGTVGAPIRLVRPEISVITLSRI